MSCPLAQGVPSQITSLADKTAEIIERVVVPGSCLKNGLPVPLFVRDCYNEPSSPAALCLTAPRYLRFNPEPEEEEEEEEEIIVPVPDGKKIPRRRWRDDTPADDKTSPYAQWDASTVLHGANWGFCFREIVSWKGRNYR